MDPEAIFVGGEGGESASNLLITYHYIYYVICFVILSICPYKDLMD